MNPKYIIAFVILIIVILIIYDLTKYKQVSINNRKWNVIRSYHDSEQAALLLSDANNRMIKLFHIMKEKYHIDKTDEEIAKSGNKHLHAIMTPNDIRNMAGVLITNYNPDAFYETDPKYTSDTSYTIDKGESMYLCLRDKHYPHKLIDLNTVLFVMIHECAHVANYKYWGHTQYFWSIFKWLLHESVEAGIYQPIDYSKYPVNFCGLHVAYSPLYDKTLPNLWL